MPKEAFFRLDKDKQAEISAAATAEFVEHGLRVASTNNIVKAAGISKGSLFYYFDGKEDLFAHTVDLAAGRLVERLEAGAKEWPREILSRLRHITVIGLDMLIEEPQAYHLLSSMLDADASAIRERYMREQMDESLAIFFRWMEDIETENLRMPVGDALQLIAWVYAGLKIELLYTRPAGDNNLVEFKRQFLERLDKAIGALRHAIYTTE